MIGFEVTSKRRRGFPSETEVKRGDRLVHGNKELIEKLAAMTYVRAALDGAFKLCCLRTGRYDGAVRNYYF